MSRRYFGTDGVRGKVGEMPVTPDFVMRLGYAAGTVLASRTHNPQEIERPMATRASKNLGKVRRINDADGRYIEFCKSTFPNDLDLRGLRVVVDCANGATYHIAPPVFHELGAEVIPVANTPNGMNINHECGATYPESLQNAVRQHRADFGITLDGDGDRLMMADADGSLYDGDQLLYAIAKFRHQAGYFKGGVVGTLMTNFGFELAMR